MKMTYLTKPHTTRTKGDIWAGQMTRALGEEVYLGTEATQKWPLGKPRKKAPGRKNSINAG